MTNEWTVLSHDDHRIVRARAKGDGWINFQIVTINDSFEAKVRQFGLTGPELRDALQLGRME